MKNWKTTATGAAGVLAGVAALLTQLTSGSPDGAVLMTSITGIITGVGLIFAKDHDVTGGSVRQ